MRYYVTNALIGTFLAANPVAAATWLREDTATTIMIGPFLDATDGVSAEEGLGGDGGNIETNVRVSKNGGGFETRSSTENPIHSHTGWYTLHLETGDTSTPGTLIVKVHDSSTYMPVWMEFQVVPANVYDSLVGGTVKLEADAVAIGGSTAAANNIEDAFDEAGGSAVAMALESLTISGATILTGNVAMQDGLTITRSTSNQPGVSITGNGAGAGISANGGFTGVGAEFDGGSFNEGLKVAGPALVTGNFAVQDGVTITRATANAAGLSVTGNGTGHGAVFTSGSGATGNGIQATAASMNGSGFSLTGSGSGFGLAGSVGGTVNANVIQWLGNGVATPTVPGVPEVDITHVLGDPVCD
jgi:hypothetical protein